MLVTTVTDDELVIDNVAVSPAAQGRGLGTVLLRQAERFAAGYGLGRVRLYTNEAMTENVDYYARRGFVETHRAIDDGFRRVYFTKRLELPG